MKFSSKLTPSGLLAVLTASGSSLLCAPAYSLDLTNLINQATQLTTQAGQIQALIPGQTGTGAAPNQQAPQGAMQTSPINTTLARNQESSGSAMQVIVAFQMQWRADGCFFSQAQEITCQITVANTGGDKKLSQSPQGVSIIDSQGTEYRAAAGGFGRNEARTQVFANGVETVGVFHFRNVDPNTSAIKRLILKGGDPIVWSDVPLSRGAMPNSTGGFTSAVATAPTAQRSNTSTPATNPGIGSLTPAAGTTQSPTSPSAAALPLTAGARQNLSLASATTTNSGLSTGGAPALSVAPAGAQPAAHDVQRAQRAAARAAFAASSGKAAH